MAREFNSEAKDLIKDAEATRKRADRSEDIVPVSYTHLRAHETVLDLVCRLLLEKKKKYRFYYAYVSSLTTSPLDCQTRLHSIMPHTRLMKPS